MRPGRVSRASTRSSCRPGGSPSASSREGPEPGDEATAVVGCGEAHDSGDAAGRIDLGQLEDALLRAMGRGAGRVTLASGDGPGERGCVLERRVDLVDLRRDGLGQRLDRGPVVDLRQQDVAAAFEPEGGRDDGRPARRDQERRIRGIEGIAHRAGEPECQAVMRLARLEPWTRADQELARRRGRLDRERCHRRGSLRPHATAGRIRAPKRAPPLDMSGGRVR